MSTRDSLGTLLDSNGLNKKKQIASAFKIKLSIKDRQAETPQEIRRPIGELKSFLRKEEKNFSKHESVLLINILKKSLQEELSPILNNKNDYHKQEDMEKNYRDIFQSEVEQQVINTKLWSGNNVIKKVPFGRMENILRVYINTPGIQRKGLVRNKF